MYFGKTKNPDPEKYNGSGSYWKEHLNKYGIDISTIFFEEFDNQDDANEFAEFFSEEFDIVNSDRWANLMIEDARIGWPSGERSEETKHKLRLANLGENNPNYGNPNNYKHSEEILLKISESNSGQKRTEETKNNISNAVKKQYDEGKISPLKGKDHSGKNNAFYGKHHTEESLALISLKKTGVPHIHEIVKCPHCNKSGIKPNMIRWHFDNCKKLLNIKK